MTTIYGKLLGGSRLPYGRAEDQSPPESTTLEKDILEKKSISNLVFLIREQERMIEHLQSELDYFKAKAVQLNDWREKVQ